MKEECVSFSNRDGEILRGIMHHGKTDREKDAVIIGLNTGLNHKVGWHGLQVNVARKLSDLGYSFLRFDDAGIGDSDGELWRANVVELFIAIESGHFKKNALAAVDYVKSACPGKKIILFGFCGGAITAILTAAELLCIKGVIEFGAPPTLSRMKYLNKADSWSAQKTIKEYHDKIFNPKAWMRFFFGKSEHKRILKAVRIVIKNKIMILLSPQKGIEMPENINWRFFDCFEKIMTEQEIPILFCYAGVDSATNEFKKYFLEYFKRKKIWNEQLCRYIEYEHATHTFKEKDAETRFVEDVCSWLACNNL